MSSAMTKEERGAFLADLHVGVISIAEEGRGPLTVPIWYFYSQEARSGSQPLGPREKGKLLVRECGGTHCRD